MNILTELFKSIVIMSTTSSIVILMVLLLRVMLRKGSRKLIYGLWLIVAIRLIIPATLPSNFSIFNLFTQNNITDGRVFSSDASDTNFDTITHTNTNTLTNTNIIVDTGTEESSTTVFNTNTTFSLSVFGYVLNLPQWSVVLWLSGIGIFVLYFVFSYISLMKKLNFATLVLDTDCPANAYYCENISAPFVFGIIKPQIYLPYGIKGTSLDLILQHEQYHIQKRDYLFKLLAFLLLAIYWFCPMVWIAYYFFQKDMELRCDEAILKNASIETRKCYCSALLAFAGNNRKYIFSPVAFSENNTKERIKFSLKSHKLSVFATSISVILIIILSVICLTDNKNENNIDDKTHQSEDTKDIEATKDNELTYGLYNLYESTEYGSGLTMQLEISEDTIKYGSPWASSSPIEYEYTIKDCIIYAQNDYDELEIEIVNSLHLKLDDKIYTFEPYNGIDVDSYINELTESDINSAIEVAKEYYNTPTYEEIISITLCMDYNIWHYQIEANNYVPGYMIILETEAVWSGNVYPNTRWMTLYRNDNTNNQWTILNEGK